MAQPRAGKELVAPPMVAQKKIPTNDDERARGAYSAVLWSNQGIVMFGE